MPSSITMPMTTARMTVVRVSITFRIIGNPVRRTQARALHRSSPVCDAATERLRRRRQTPALRIGLRAHDMTDARPELERRGGPNPVRATMGDPTIVDEMK